ncbi:HEAT repeat domain-containing protein [bacterium]|nr:HEAT repeat domain-containing protein [bacterium]
MEYLKIGRSPTLWLLVLLWCYASLLNLGCEQNLFIKTGDNEMLGSPLTKAISRGMNEGGDLSNELNKLGAYTLRSRGDAKAICRALEQLPDNLHDDELNTERYRALTGLFQDVESAEVPAFEVMHSQGIPALIRVYDKLIENPSEECMNTLLFALKVLAMYGSPEGTDRIIEAARKPLGPEEYMWSVILSIFDEKHPHTGRLFTELSNPIPPGFIAVSLLDAANTAAIAGNTLKHPFDSPEGWARLEQWLTVKDPEQFSYAHSATAALPFINSKEQSRLLAIASNHPDPSVRMESAWAAAKVGNETGIRNLIAFSLEPNHSATACQYLEELGRTDAIPAEAREPDFAAKAEFAHWLSHPNELGRPPDKLEIVDKRTLKWPPEYQKKDLWLIKYTVYDDTGLEEDDVEMGLVGSTTFCFFSYNLTQRPPEDGYAIHCCWELEGEGLIKEKDIESPEVYLPMLEQWHGDELLSPEIVHIVEISPQLRYPQNLVAVAAATLNGNSGWVVLDGDRSSWYGKDELPDTLTGTIAKVHIGRQLLGFYDNPDRKKYLSKEAPEKKPEDIVKAYEHYLDRVIKGDAHEQKSLLADYSSPLGKHLTRYAKAYAHLHDTTEDEVIIRVYDQFLDVIAAGNDELKKNGYDTFRPIGEMFDKYVDALIKTDKKEKVLSLVSLLGPWWDHNTGYDKLGTAAYKASDYQTAEHYFLKLQSNYQNWERFDGTGLLARIWFHQGKKSETEQLLLECMQRIFDEAKEAKGPDRKSFEKWYQDKKDIFTELFPDIAVKRLNENNLPQSTLRPR